MQLVEAGVVVLALEVLLDGREHLLDAGEAGVEVGDLIPGGHLLEKVGHVVLAGQLTNLEKDVAGGFVDALQAVFEVHKLLIDRSRV